MKKLAILSVMAAFVFGYNATPVQAGNNVIEIEEVTSNGSAQAAFNEASEIITLRMSSALRQERVAVSLISNDSGKAVFEEKVVVDNRGHALEIPMAGLKPGVYTLRVNGQSIKYSDRFKKK